jgi:hypothetical protein
VGSRILPIRAVSNEEIGSASSLRRLRKAFVHRAAKEISGRRLIAAPTTPSARTF